MDNIRFVNERTADLLREIGNIGTAHAASALSEMLRQPVSIQVPRVDLVPFDDMAELIGDPEQVVVGVYLTLSGDFTGSLFFVQTPQAAKSLIAEVLPDALATTRLSDMEISALAEMGNIMAANYLSSLMTFTGLQLSADVPMVAVDMAQAVLSVGLIRSLGVSHYALVVHTRIHHLSAIEDAHVFLLPDPGAERVLQNALGVALDS
ncbi:MAG: chemotaxis protein CheC [Firmicutes bacterium]|nr:chemotaxis protein CheC [Bacillota bacterium]